MSEWRDPRSAAAAEAMFRETLYETSVWAQFKNRYQQKDISMTKTVEYRSRPITRFIVTRWHDDRDMDTMGSETCGEFPNEEQALAAARGLVSLEPGARLIRPEYPVSPAGFTADGDYVGQKPGGSR